MIEDIWCDSSYSEAVADYFEEKGIEKGQLMTMHMIAHEMIAARFSEITQALLARIDALTDMEVLRRLVMHEDEIGDVAELGIILDVAEATQPSE